MKKFVIGDIHGNYKALMQCLEKSKIDYDKDKLIVLGDVVDGLPQVKECVDELLKFKNLVYILGNHDEWAYEWYGERIQDQMGGPKYIWTSQGGANTIKSYGSDMPESHLKLLREAPIMHLEYHYDNAYLFVHGGINPNKKIENQDRDVVYGIEN